MKKSSYCYTTSSNHLCKQPSHPSTAFQTLMSPFIYHILLPLADLSLIYSCRLHGQSICHATRSINLHISCISRDRSIFISAAYPAIGKSAYPLLNWSIYISAACFTMKESVYLHISCTLHDEGICLSATQLINLHISCIFCDQAICLLAM